MFDVGDGLKAEASVSLYPNTDHKIKKKIKKCLSLSVGLKPENRGIYIYIQLF